VTPTRLTSFAAALALLIAGCGAHPAGDGLPQEDGVAPTVGAPAADLAAAKERWAAAGITTYHYEAFLDEEDENTRGPRCGISGSWVVQVIDGEVTLAHDKSGACAIELSDPQRPPLTVEEWLTFIESVMLDAGPDVTELGARFDARGVPSEVFMDSPQGFVDGGIQELTVGLIADLPRKLLLTELDSARAQWENSGPASYRFHVELQCFCGDQHRGPFDVLVLDGVVVEARLDGKAAAASAPYDYFTVTDLFAAVERFAFSDGITVDYDPNFGFPAIIDADPERNAIDDEIRIIVRAFEEIAT
jgi:hypothetical protein